MSDELVSVRYMQEPDVPAWDRFVDGCAQATFFHKAGWRRVIEEAFGHRTYFLMAERGQAITGVLPLGRVSSVLFGRALISTPFCVYGGVAAQDDASRIALEQAAVKLAEELEVDYLEVRNRDQPSADWPSKNLYVAFSREMADTVDGNLQAVPRKQRAMIRKAMKLDLSSEAGRDVEQFYRVYSESVRNLGTPVFSKRYFRILLEEFADCSDILLVREARGRAIAGVLSFYFRDEILPYYGGGTAEARRLKGNDFMYWELMRRACEAGIKVFDYGRSKRETGSYSFKKNWGFEPRPLHYQYHLVRASEVPNVSPANPKYRLMVNTWRRLPLGMANLMGPIISSKLG